MLEPQIINSPFRIPDNLIRLEDRLRPENVFDVRFLFKCKIKILIVTDSSGGFSEATSFHIGQIIKILDDDPWSHIEFEISKAHREASPEANVLDNFRFNTHDLNQYSQIWMFGIHRVDSGNPLSDAELKAVSQFMDAGGGVLAMGDHEDLGNSMCAKVPRVSSMRRWYHPNPGPNGEPVAPDQTGLGRHDTLVDGGMQTDPVPQVITPKWYSRTIGGGLVKHVFRYPHPLLCGPNGPINFLPDHMHEGNCEIPTNLANSFTFDGDTFVEYPTKDSHQEVPEIIATATNNVSPNRFGVIGAYNGHAVDVGRVVVDATWHHWFNINTLAYVNASNPTHPTYTPNTVQKWEEIKSYYRNVAVWLAKPSLQNCIRNGGWIRTLGDADIRITVRDLKLVKNRSLYFWQLGVFAKDALGRGATKCQTLRWIIDILAELEIPFRIDPFRQFPDSLALPDTPPGLDFDEFETTILGAAIHGAFEKFGNTKVPEKLLDDDGKAFSKILLKSAKLGANAFEENFKDTNKAMKLLMERFR